MTAISRDAASRFPERESSDRFASGVAAGDPSASFDLLLAPPPSSARTSRASEGNEDRREFEPLGRDERRSRGTRPDRSDEALRPRIEPPRRSETRPAGNSPDSAADDSAATTDRSAPTSTAKPVAVDAESDDEEIAETHASDGTAELIGAPVTSVAPIETLPEASSDLEKLDASNVAISASPIDSEPNSEASGEPSEANETASVDELVPTDAMPLVAPASKSADVTEEPEPSVAADEPARPITSASPPLVVPRRGSRSPDVRGRASGETAGETPLRPIADHLQHLERSAPGGRAATVAVEATILSSKAPVSSTTDVDVREAEPTSATGDDAGSRRTDFVGVLSEVFGIEPSPAAGSPEPAVASESIDTALAAIETPSESGATRLDSAPPTAPANSVTTDARAVPLSAVASPPVGISPPRTGGTDGVRTRHGIDPVEHRRFLHRVGRAFEAAEARGGEIRMRLSPPRLGGLSLEVRLDGDKLAARVETETEAARQLILEQLPVLRDRLAERGISIETFDVGLFREAPGEGGSPREERSGDEGGTRRRAVPTSDSEREGERVVCRPFGGADGRGIDVRI